MSSLQTLWSRNSAQWQLLSSPLRPCSEDLGLYQQALANWRDTQPNTSDRILLLGVTQELRGMVWPADAELLSCDHSRSMIDALWPGVTFTGTSAAAICADWQEMPLRLASRNIALGDGWASMVAPDALRRIAGELRRVLEPDGILATRFYLFPQRAEAPEAVAADALAGKMRSFHAFKWRFAMAVQGETDRGVRLADIWDCFTVLLRDRQALSKHTGWTQETIGTVDSYRDAQSRYYYRRLEDYAQLLGPEFEIVSARYPGYELGERCPVIAARRC